MPTSSETYPTTEPAAPGPDSGGLGVVREAGSSGAEPDSGGFGAVREAAEPVASALDSGGLVRLRLAVAYDGTAFAGWAPQPGQRTVAGVLADALGRVLRAPVRLTVAGRTDAGVHATGQVAHTDVSLPAWQQVASSTLRRLAGMLPADVRVTAVGPAPAGFDARFSALFRRYAYRMTDAPSGASPLRRHDTLAWPHPLDLGVLRAASSALLGEHDFAAYCRRREGATSVRTLRRLDWSREPDGVLVATAEADAFCQSMVRSLIGALLAVGDGRQPVDWPAGQLRAGQRSGAVTVAPPHGLTLVHVGYPPDADLAARAELTRRRRTPPAMPVGVPRQVPRH